MIHRRVPTYVDRSGTRMTERVQVGGPEEVPLAEVLAALEDAGDHPVFVHSAMFSWTRPATDEEHQASLDRTARDQERIEKWERETWIRLIEKYGGFPT